MICAPVTTVLLLSEVAMIQVTTHSANGLLKSSMGSHCLLTILLVRHELFSSSNGPLRAITLRSHAATNHVHDVKRDGPDLAQAKVRTCS